MRKSFCSQAYPERLWAHRRSYQIKQNSQTLYLQGFTDFFLFLGKILKTASILLLSPKNTPFFALFVVKFVDDFQGEN